ncbi:MAG: hypothetical protein ABI665_02590 [Vicinamibacterales bacterium]
MTVVVTLVIVILLGQIAREERIVHRLKGELATAQQDVDQRAAKLANERLSGHREDIVRAARWLQEYYQSDDGLRRADGLWLAGPRQIDAEAIGAWLFDVYLTARIAGQSDEAARRDVSDAIRNTDEWQLAHRAR